MLKVVIVEPPDEVVAATLASIIMLALRCAFSTGDNVGSVSKLKNNNVFVFKQIASPFHNQV